jgi:hypothetical protein
MNPFLRFYTAIRKSGWFVPSPTGALFPFPFAWQAWAMLAAFIAALVGTIFLPIDLGWVCRISLCAGYIGLGMISYDAR